MEGSVALDRLYPPREFFKFQRIVSGERPFSDDSQFIQYPGCRFGAENTNEDGERFVEGFFKERKSLPDETKKNSPFYALPFCPNLVQYFRSHEVFWMAAEDVAKLPHVKRIHEVRLVYPGSGGHLAPLDLFHNLIQKGVVDKASAIFTEIDDRSLIRIKTLLAGLIKRGVYANLKIQTKKYLEGGSETVFSFKYHGKPIEIVFALKRSQDKYYREEYLAQSDVWIIHDPGTWEKGDSIRLLDSFLRSLNTNENIVGAPVIVMENVNGLDSEELLKGERKIIPFPYGHRDQYIYDNRYGYHLSDETGFPNNKSALIFHPDLNFWEKLSSSEVHAVMKYLVEPDVISLKFKKRDEVFADFKLQVAQVFGLIKKLGKNFPKFTQRLIEHIKTRYPDLKVENSLKNYELRTTYFSEKDLRLPSAIEQWTIGEWNQFVCLESGLRKERSVLEESDFLNPLRALLYPLFPFRRKMGFTFTGCPIYVGLFDNNKNFIGLMRRTKSEAPEFLKLSDGHWARADKMDFIQYPFILESGAFYVVNAFTVLPAGLLWVP